MTTTDHQTLAEPMAPPLSAKLSKDAQAHSHLPAMANCASLFRKGFVGEQLSPPLRSSKRRRFRAGS